jgi:hypothetical protein
MPRRSRRRPNRHVDDGEWKKMRQDKIFKVIIIVLLVEEYWIRPKVSISFFRLKMLQ